MIPMERRFPRFRSNMIAIILGMIMFGSEPILNGVLLIDIKRTLFGGYLFVSIYHAFLFGSRRISGTSMMIMWMMPLIIIFFALYSMIYGLITSIPLTIYSWFQRKKERQQQSDSQQQYQEQPQHNHHRQQQVREPYTLKQRMSNLFKRITLKNLFKKKYRKIKRQGNVVQFPAGRKPW